MQIVWRTALVLVLGSACVEAQLTLEQKFHDFQNVAALYAKRYAPLSWKRQLFGVDLLDLTPWLARITRSKDDLDFLEICAEYVAGLNDAHAAFLNSSSFVADSGLYVDIYDGKVLVDGIDRALLPRNRYPIEIGDELVSVDGRLTEELLAEFTRLRRLGSPSATRRNAADLIVFRQQAVAPRAVELPEVSRFQVRLGGGELESYDIRWDKSGYPLRRLGPVPSPATLSAKSGRRAAEEGAAAFYMKPLLDLQNWALRQNDPLLRRRPAADEEISSFVLGLGNRTPPFAPPPNFAPRLGRSSFDFHFSGTYPAGGKRLGYLRIPDFMPPNRSAAVRELDAEIAFFQENTDGLVVDVMRNQGGTCYMLTVTSYLIPEPFFFFGQEIRASLAHLNAFQAALDAARLFRAPQWIIDLYEFYLGQIKTAYEENRGLTGPIPACSLSFENEPARGQGGRPLAYTKPMIVLIDEFTSSAAEIFAAMIQDNRRGLLVGHRTTGAGGSVTVWDTGFFSETSSSTTETLVVRRQPVVIPGFPATDLIESVGVHPDVPLELMTRENLLQRGLPFVQDFTGVLVDRIERSR